MISSSIHADRPQNFRRNFRTGCSFCSATSLTPCSFRRTSTSAPVRPVSGFTWSAASVSGIDSEAMSGGFAVAGLVDAVWGPGLLGLVRIRVRLFMGHQAASRAIAAGQSPFPVTYHWHDVAVFVNGLMTTDWSLDRFRQPARDSGSSSNRADGLIRLERLGCETGKIAAEIGAVEGRVFVDLFREEDLAERAVMTFSTRSRPR